MSRIQLRIHGDANSLGAEITGAVLKVLPVPLKTGIRGRALAHAFRGELGEALRRWLVSTELCGALTWCSDELEELGGGDERMATPGMRVFLLADRVALPGLITFVSAVSYRLLVRSLRKEEVREIGYAKIAQAVESTLMHHAFRNQLCGEAAICKENLALGGRVA